MGSGKRFAVIMSSRLGENYSDRSEFFASGMFRIFVTPNMLNQVLSSDSLNDFQGIFIQKELKSDLLGISKLHDNISKSIPARSIIGHALFIRVDVSQEEAGKKHEKIHNKRLNWVCQELQMRKANLFFFAHSSHFSFAHRYLHSVHGKNVCESDLHNSNEFVSHRSKEFPYFLGKLVFVARTSLARLNQFHDISALSA